MEQLNKLKQYVEEDIDYEVEDYIFIELNGRVGVIYCIESLEGLDNHCDQCRNELLIFGFRADKKAPDFLCANVGPTKFNRIISGDRNFGVINFNTVKLYNLFGEPINVK